MKHFWCGRSIDGRKFICRVILIKGLGCLSRYSHFLLKWTETRQAIAFQERAMTSWKECREDGMT